MFCAVAREIKIHVHSQYDIVIFGMHIDVEIYRWKNKIMADFPDGPAREKKKKKKMNH